MLQLRENERVVTIQEEVGSNFASYQKIYALSASQFSTTAYSVTYDDPDVTARCLILGYEGPTRVHARSGLLHNKRCIIGVSNCLVALQLPSLEMLWQREVDTATCFGVYHIPQFDSYLSHGELDITRVSYAGNVIWSSGGKDIFTNGFTLYDDYVITVDFNDEKYRIDLAPGRSEIIS